MNTMINDHFDLMIKYITLPIKMTKINNFLNEDLKKRKKAVQDQE